MIVKPKEQVTINVAGYDTMQTVKSRIQEKAGIPEITGDLWTIKSGNFLIVNEDCVAKNKLRYYNILSLPGKIDLNYIMYKHREATPLSHLLR